MSEKTENLPAVDFTFNYGIGGKLEPIPYPFAGKADTGDYDVAMKTLGLEKVSEWEGESLSVTLYASEEPKWMFEFFDGLKSCSVYVDGWAAYLDARAFYAPMLAPMKEKLF